MRKCWCAGNCPHFRKANKLLEREHRPAAEIAVRRALLAAPDCPEANRLMGLFLTQNNQAVFGTPHFDRALACDDSEALFAQAGWNRRMRGDVDQAITIFRHGLELYPQSVSLYEGLIVALELAGDYQGAEQCIGIASALPHRGPIPPFRRLAASVANSAGDNARAIAILSAEDLDHLELADRGRYFDQAGRFDDAWRDWMTAKTFLRDRAGHHYDSDAQERLVNALRRTAMRAGELAPKDPYTWPPAGSPRPLFIGGFPRSGTTMIETALTRHPAIAAGDELPFLNEIFEQLPAWLGAPAAYPDAMQAFGFGINAGKQDAARMHYIYRAYAKIGLRPGAGGPAFFTDKMPLHEMHLGLISVLFPDSVFVYVRRHPLDILVSNLSRYLVHGNFYASSLESAAFHYVLLDKLHRFYSLHLRFPVTEIRYEGFVADSESGVLNLFRPLELEPMRACVEFHDNPRHSRTMSHDQVRKPAYTSSVGRWRPYRKYLAPVLPALREICDREGYELE